MIVKKRKWRHFLWSFVTRFIILGKWVMSKLGYNAWWKLSFFQIEKIHLELTRLPREFSGLRVAQISDIPMGGWMNRQRFQRVANLIVAQKPDLLLITGDFLLGHRFTDSVWQFLEDLTAVLSPLAKSIPSFAVLGNHDCRMNPEAVRQMLSVCGVTDLTNTVVTLTRQGHNLHLCGVDDIWYGHVQLKNVLAQLTDNGAAVLLAHEPDYADTSAATGKFDLQISGHTHGGQIVIPFYGAPMLPHLGHKYPRGLYKIGDMFQYTNRGIGMHSFAFRFNCRPEITIFELKSAS